MSEAHAREDGASSVTMEPRNFVGGLWHGAFLALGMALTEPTTVISSFVVDLTGSTVWVGGFSTVLTVAAALPQLLVARLIEPRPRKMPFLLLAIYLRVFSWGVLAWLVHSIGTSRPDLLIWVLVGLLALFYAGGGLGGVPYNDIIGKVIPLRRRGAFFAGKELLASPLAAGAALGARHILATRDYPDNYALLFGLAALSLGVASLGFWLIREPPRSGQPQAVETWREYSHHLLVAGRKLRVLVEVQLLTGFSLMALPFYVVYGREVLGAPVESTGWFLLIQVLGGIVANPVWARLIDRHGSRRMLAVCASTAALIPVLAIVMGQVGWQGLLPVFFLIGAVVSGRRVGFSTALLELAPGTERPTYTALNAALTLPIAILPLLAGLILRVVSYPVLFALVTGFIALGAVRTRRLPRPTAASEAA